MNRIFHKSSAFTIAVRLALGLFLTGGCSSLPQPAEEPLHSAHAILKEDVDYPVDIFDPLEPLNRGIFYFNAQFDRYLYLPLVNGYQAIVPDFVEQRITNFFDNIAELSTLTNTLLQLKFKQTAATAGRMTVNTTIGLLGLFDVATEFGIPKYDEDLGQTLGHYGLGAGPFLVLPVLGPSNFRDTAGLVGDSAVFTLLDPFNFEDHPERMYIYYALKALDRRAQVDYRYHQSGSAFEYEWIRYLYTQKRRLDIRGNVQAKTL